MIHGVCWAELTVAVMVHGVCWTELTDMQLTYGAPTGSSSQASLLYCIGISSVTFPAANNNATLLILV